MPSDGLEHRSLLAASGLFDRSFYLERNRDVAAARVDPADHYLTFGWREGRRPGPGFDGAWYLREYPDVARAGVNPLVHYLESGRREGRRPHSRFVVYTAIIGNYDPLRVPLAADSDVDYVAFVDDWIVDVPAPWLRRSYDVRHGSDRLTARFLKVHPHLVLPEYDVSVWVDAAFHVRWIKPGPLIEYLGDAPIAMFRHPERDCAYDEAEAVLQHDLDDPEAIRAALACLAAENHPRHAGLFATGVVIRRHGDVTVQAAMAEWWTLIAQVSSRDQLSVNLVLQRAGLPVALIPGSIWENDLAVWVSHGPKPWKGLQCGGAYLDAEEYQAIEDMVGDLNIRSVVETGAGETAVLFKRLGVAALSIESHPGPWSRRAAAHGCQVAEVPFDLAEAQFSQGALRAALNGRAEVDLVFIDSPVGTENRRAVLTQLLALLRVGYVMYHDVRRDLANVLADQVCHGLSLVRFVDSPRGLAIFRCPSAALEPAGAASADHHRRPG